MGVSCSSGNKPVYQVTGKVLFEGKPASGAVVMFYPQEKQDGPGKLPVIPQGHVGDDGTFKLTTYAFEDGVPAGRYAVTVTWGVPAKGGDTYQRLLVPHRYLTPATSGLTAEVRPDTTDLPPFKLTK